MVKKTTSYQHHWNGISHVRIPMDVLNSEAWRALSFSDKALYLDMRAKLRSTNNGDINATISEMKHRGWKSSATLWKALKTLEHMGFIARTRTGGIASLSKVCNLYRFTDLPCLEFPKKGIEACPATNNHRRFESVKAAKAAVAEIKSTKKIKGKKLKLVG